jgi:site-specific recombinase XerD
MEENGLFRNGCQDVPLFVNQRRSKLTRGGVSYILSKYADKIAEENPNFPKGPTPHWLRHSKAMHMYQAGVSLIYIRDLFGHVDISVTDTYARADVEMKRKQLENVCPVLTPTNDELPDWSRDQNLLDYLNNF